ARGIRPGRRARRSSGTRCRPPCDGHAHLSDGIRENTRMLTRRQFIGRSALAMAGSAVLPSFLARAALAAQQGGALSRYGDDTILIVIQMSGGNDGLNTVVPYGVDGYYQARPNLGIK